MLSFIFNGNWQTIKASLWKSVVDFSGEQSHLYVPVYGTILIKLPVPASCSNCGSFPLQFYFEV